MIEPLGDQAVLLTAADEAQAAAWAAAIRRQRPAWLVDLVLAYQSVGLFFDLHQVQLAEVLEWGRRFVAGSPPHPNPPPPVGRGPEASRERQRPEQAEIIIMPCCYELGPDLHAAATALKLTPADLIARHAATVFQVYAIGFSPGFPYLGYLPAELQGLPRLPSPRPRVEVGSVGITGRQCCIYPSATPGGWNLIGRTPRKLVDLEAEFFPLRPGDRVQFQPISEAEFNRQLGQPLDPAA